MLDLSGGGMKETLRRYIQNLEVEIESGNQDIHELKILIWEAV